MAQLTFVYGTVNSGKSLELMRVATNYEQLGKRAYILTPSLDTRSAEPKVWSRAGLEMDATRLYPNMRVADLLVNDYDIILVDEAQFLTGLQVNDLAMLVDTLDIPVMAFGLRTDSNGQLFEGSSYLFAVADKLQEIKTLDYMGSGKATMNLKVVDGLPVYDEDNILDIESRGESKYYPVSRKHYYKPDLGKV